MLRVNIVMEKSKLIVEKYIVNTNKKSPVHLIKMYTQVNIWQYVILGINY